MEASSGATAPGDGRYLYCVADSGARVSLGKIGLDSSEVYTVPYRDICAVVHRCAAEPYQSSDGEVVKDWVVRHQKVVDAAWEKWGTVLPLGFNTIIRGDAEGDAEQNVRRWLEEDYENLRRKMAKVRGKAEYGVQIFWDLKVIAQIIAATSPEIGKLEEEIRSKPKGLAYMYRQRLENLLKKEMEAKADQCFKECYGRIRQHAADIRVEKTKKAEPPTQMLLNLSCLVSLDDYPKLGEELGKIAAMEGFSVRFTGPWPPYSFVDSA